jgi:hypothetical protein
MAASVVDAAKHVYSGPCTRRKTAHSGFFDPHHHYKSTGNKRKLPMMETENKQKSSLENIFSIFLIFHPVL